MRWLLIGLLISVVVLLAVADSALRYVRRQRRTGTGEVPDVLVAEEIDAEPEAAIDPGAQQVSPGNAADLKPGEKL